MFTITNAFYDFFENCNFMYSRPILQAMRMMVSLLIVHLFAISKSDLISVLYLRNKTITPLHSLTPNRFQLHIRVRQRRERLVRIRSAEEGCR